MSNINLMQVGPLFVTLKGVGILQGEPTIPIKFEMHHPNNDNYAEFDLNSMKILNFDVTKKYIFLAHGWTGSANMNWYSIIAQEFATHSDTIVIGGHYKEALNCTLYFGAVRNLEAIAKKYSQLIFHLYQQGLSLQNVEIVGHSLGSHIAGIMGKEMYRKTGQRVRRIFGLDPASPLIPRWRLNLPHRLVKTDAERLIVIHTSILGVQAPLGHVDFFPNGGLYQLECSRIKNNVWGSHGTVLYYFACSINKKCTLMGYDCANYYELQLGNCYQNSHALMGYHVDDMAQGNFYLTVECSKR